MWHLSSWRLIIALESNFVNNGHPIGLYSQLKVIQRNPEEQVNKEHSKNQAKNLELYWKTGISRMFDKEKLPIAIRFQDYEYEIEYSQVWFLNFKPVAFPEPLLFMLALGREGSSWDENVTWKCQACKLELRSHIHTQSRPDTQSLSCLLPVCFFFVFFMQCHTSHSPVVNSTLYSVCKASLPPAPVGSKKNLGTRFNWRLCQVQHVIH